MRHASFFLLLCFTPLFQPAGHPPALKPANDQHATVKTYPYGDGTIPQFFRSLARNHQRDFARRGKKECDSVFSRFGIDPGDSGNLATYYTIDILHKLFTSKSCIDGSRGDILNIPYLWHWVSPNPRHAICFTDGGKPLTSVRHPAGFERYATFADIDRTPWLYLGDLFAPRPKYFSAEQDTFSTFGWCSEREMAFTSLVTLMGYKGHVIAPGNHSWTELEVKAKLMSGGTATFLVTVDNTFDYVIWNYFYPSPSGSRYDRTAHSGSILTPLKNTVFPSAAMNRIEARVVAYLRKN